MLRAGSYSTSVPQGLDLEKPGPGRPSNKDFLKVLSTHKDSWIPRDLPEGIQIANKPGSLEGVRNDSGIVLGVRPYVICVMTTFAAGSCA